MITPDAPILVQSLTDGWTIALDPRNTGRQDEWFRGQPAAEVREARVPGSIQQAFPGQYGLAWYWCSFAPPRLPAIAERALLCFHAVDYLAEVWLNGQHLGGHEGGETPFTLDATTALLPTENLLAVRVLNPTKTPIDGIVLDQTPHSNKMMPEDFHPGSGRNYGGILRPVELMVAPAVRLTDIFVRPDPTNGRIAATITVRNDGAAPVTVDLRMQAGPARDGVVLATTTLAGEAVVGETRYEATLLVPHHRLWSLEDPYLYRVEVALEAGARTGDLSDSTLYRHTLTLRCGFRDFRVADGFFRLNGRRLFVRSTHGHATRRDAIMAKASGFNMVRYIAGMGRPEELDFCDEIGLLVYEETRAAWMLGDSPQLGEHFDRSVREMILRDRYHASLVIWGLLNETRDNPTFRHAVGMLPLIRELDTTRAVVLSSGRWDRDLGIGTVCNPGSAQWAHVWGQEGSSATPAAPTVHGMPWDEGQAAYVTGAGDAHVYPQVPQSDETNAFLRTLGRASKPVFLSEYGIGSLLDVVHIMGRYQQAGEAAPADDLEVYQTMRDLLEADWTRFGMDATYPFPRDLLRESQRLHSRHRLEGLNLIRSNPRINGHNVTGMLDHGYTGEGLWTLFREWKPGVAEALEDGWAPLRWCLFVTPRHTYAGQEVTVEAVLANEDVLRPGAFPARLRIFGPSGSVWDQGVTAHLPAPAPGGDGPLAVPVFRGNVSIVGPAGAYVLAAHMEQGGSPAGDRLTFHVSDPAALPQLAGEVMTWGLDERVTAWLVGRGLRRRPFEGQASSSRAVIVVGDLSSVAATEADWRALAEQMARGSTVLFLSPLAFRRGDDLVGWLPLAVKGRYHVFSNWVYHREDVAKPHPIFAGLPAPGILEWDYYGPVIPRYVFEGQEAPNDIAVAYFAVGYASLIQRVKTGYAAGLITAWYPFGAGRFLLNSLQVLENVGRHPAADRLLLNMLAYSMDGIARPPAPLPDGFDGLLNTIGYPS